MALAAAFALFIVVPTLGTGNWLGLVLGLLVLIAALLLTNVGGLRSRTPVLGSSNVRVTAGGWAVLALVGFIGLGVAGYVYGSRPEAQESRQATATARALATALSATPAPPTATASPATPASRSGP